MNVREVQQRLRVIGWPISVDGRAGPQTRDAVWCFQYGYAFAALEVDGIAGEFTSAALVECLDARDGRCAEFFRFGEFASKGNGWIKVARPLLLRLDEARRRTGPIHVVSGYRDPAHNVRVGGARNSQHVYGTASDIRPGISRDLAADLGFSGIGLSGDTAIHVDVRAEGPDNTTGAAIGRPTIWHY